MNKYADKKEQHKSLSSADVVSEKKQGTSSAFQLIDNRPSAIAQRKLKAITDTGTQMKQEVQTKEIAGTDSSQLQHPIQKKANNTGLPDNLKTGVENLSGYSLNDVKVHYNSDRPAQLQAHAYAQGTDIHVAPGQEKHLAHEAWHVVQQKQGKVKPTTQLKGKVAINNDSDLEKEADVMGTRSLQFNTENTFQKSVQMKRMGLTGSQPQNVIQRKPGDYKKIAAADGAEITVKYKKGPEKVSHSGVVNTVKSTSLYVGYERFTNSWVEEDDFEIVGIPPMLAPIDKSTIDKHRPKNVWTDEEDKKHLTEVQFAEKKKFLEILKEVVDLAETMPQSLRALMPHDRVYNMTPEGQLEYCVHICKGKTAGALAKALYTSYFYLPLNKFLRGQLPENFDHRIMALINTTLFTLMRTLSEFGVAAQINTQRVELQAEWMGSPKKDDVVRFPALTSIHEKSGGVKSMLADIGKGTFGKVTKIAVLNIKGYSQIIQPVEKYYDTEQEIIIPPGMRTRVKTVKDITLDIPQLGRTAAKEYDLEIISTVKKDKLEEKETHVQ